jgi:hypothetical protein
MHDEEMSLEEAQYYSEVEEEQCRCVGDDRSRCQWHNPRFHSMTGVEEYYRMLEQEKES